MCIFISILLCTLSIIPTHCNDRALSHSESYRTLSRLVKTLQNPTQKCPESVFLSDTEAANSLELSQSNHFYLLPLKPKYIDFLNTVITPVALHDSYRRDITRALSLAQLIINWLSIKGLVLSESRVGNVDLDNFIEPLMRAFTQTSTYYQNCGQSVINSIAICAGSERLVYVERGSRSVDDFQPPSNLCQLMTPILEASNLIPVSKTIPMLGVWAPLHCNNGTTVAGRKLPLHLIIPIPHTKSVRWVPKSFNPKSSYLDKKGLFSKYTWEFLSISKRSAHISLIQVSLLNISL